MIRNWHNMKARTLKATILRTLGQDSSAFLEESKRIDPLDMGIRYEISIASSDSDNWKRTMREPAHNYLELALDYAKAGFYKDALFILNSCDTESPMSGYYKGYIYELLGEVESAKEEHNLGEASDYSCCFPNRTEEVLILESAIRVLEKAPRAHYYLGCLLYDKKQNKKAIKHWLTSTEEEPSFAMSYRNLAIAYYNKEHDISKALPAMKRAVELDPDYSRFLLEYDQLCAKAGYSNEDRLKVLEAHIDLVTYRDALYLEYITLLNNTGQYEKALDCLTTHQFHPWEGGEGKVSAQYRYALTQKALLLLNKKQYDEAIELLEATKTYPQNVGEGKLPNVQDNIADYYLGIAYEETGNKEATTAHYLAASVGLDEPGSVLYYNDQPSDTILYQGFANEKLGNTNAARKCYHQLLSFGQKHLFDKVEYDYFAVSLPEIEVFPSNIQDQNDTYCHYLMGLAYIGLKEYAKAENELQEILKEQPGYQGAIQHMMMI